MYIKTNPRPSRSSLPPHSGFSCNPQITIGPYPNNSVCFVLQKTHNNIFYFPPPQTMTDSCTSLRPKTFDEFCMDLLRATDRCVPLRDRQYYAGVSVLAFHWEHDDIGIRAQERELLELFRSDYGFYVESISIPATAQATLNLAWRLASFTLKHGSPTRLIIFMYSGYAEWLNGSLVLSG